MPSIINGQAAAIANRLSAGDNVAFPIELIIPIAELLIQYLGTCWKSTPPAGLPGSANPSDYLRDHYDPSKDEFEPFVLQQVRGQTRRAIRASARQTGTSRLRDMTQDQVTAVSKETLKQIMNTPQVTNNALLEVVQE